MDLRLICYTTRCYLIKAQFTSNLKKFEMILLGHRRRSFSAYGFLNDRRNSKALLGIVGLAAKTDLSENVDVAESNSKRAKVNERIAGRKAVLSALVVA